MDRFPPGLRCTFLILVHSFPPIYFLLISPVPAYLPARISISTSLMRSTGAGFPVQSSIWAAP